MQPDEHKLARDTARALGAQNLVENDLLNEAFDMLESEYVRAWRTSKLDNEHGREKLYLAINVIGQVKAHLQRILIDGRVAEAELIKLAQDEERKRAYGGV